MIFLPDRVVSPKFEIGKRKPYPLALATIYSASSSKPKLLWPVALSFGIAGKRIIPITFSPSAKLKRLCMGSPKPLLVEGKL